VANRLKALTPLGHDAPETVTVGPLTITENTSFAMASLASRLGREGDVAKAASAAGIPLPGPGMSATGATYGAIWLGAEQWMLDAAFATHEDIRAALLPVFGDAASITEQTDAWVRFDLTAPDLPALFERLCNLDTRAIPEGGATRTVIEHLGCYVVKRSATQISVIGPRSSAGSLHHALITGAKSAY
jgi:sarcosine oxidase subunit gamma